MAKSEESMKKMMKKTGRYFKRKDLQLNVEKSKILCFRKGSRRKKIEWKWEVELIEEVKEFKYLGYVLQKNEGNDGLVRDIKKKVNVIRKI